MNSATSQFCSIDSLAYNGFEISTAVTHDVLVDCIYPKTANAIRTERRRVSGMNQHRCGAFLTWVLCSGLGQPCFNGSKSSIAPSRAEESERSVAASNTLVEHGNLVPVTYSESRLDVVETDLDAHMKI